MKLETFDDRIDNWAKVVRLPKFQAGVCAQWAKLYVALRGNVEDLSSMSATERDGWLIEAGWSAMHNNGFKWAMKYTHVMNMDPKAVRALLLKRHGVSLRGRDFELFMVESRRALAQSVAKITAKNAIIFSCKRQTVEL